MAIAGSPRPADVRSWRERLGALRNLPPFLAIVWQTSATMTLAEAVLRLVRALLPVVTLYIGKLIDECEDRVRGAIARSGEAAKP